MADASRASGATGPGIIYLSAPNARGQKRKVQREAHA